VDGFLTTDEVAKRIGVAPGTVHTYKKRGTLPPPDDYVGRTPLWAALTIEQWIAQRPGQGWRKNQRRQTPRAEPT
jgi:predicted DNA-binding transcriptional regulator AlpA